MKFFEEKSVELLKNFPVILLEEFQVKLRGKNPSRTSTAIPSGNPVGIGSEFPRGMSGATHGEIPGGTHEVIPNRVPGSNVAFLLFSAVFLLYSRNLNFFMNLPSIVIHSELLVFPTIVAKT